MVDAENDSRDFEEDLLNTKFLNSLIKGVRNVFLLWLISKKKIHGYGIMTTLNEISSESNAVKGVHSSTIYPILHSLERDGLIKSSQEFNGKHKVKMYEITDEGRKMLRSIKYFMHQKPENLKFISFFDDMIFNDNRFIKNGGE